MLLLVITLQTYCESFFKMSCYIPVIEKLKSLKTNVSGSNNNANDIKSNVSKSKPNNNNISTSHLQYPKIQGLQQGSQDASQSHIQPWELSSVQYLCTSNNGDSSNAKTNQNDYYINGGLDETQRKRPQSNYVSSPIHLQQHHFSVPSSLTVPSPPPSYHSNNMVIQNNISSNRKNKTCSPPPPYELSKTKCGSNLDQNTKQKLHVLPLVTKSIENESILTYQNDVNIYQQNLPPLPPKHDNKRSQSRRRDENGVTIVQQIGTFPNNVPLNIRHNHPTLGLSDVAYQRQHSDHGRYRNSSPIVSRNSSQPLFQNNEHTQSHGSAPTSVTKGVLTLGLPSHWKKLPFKKVGQEENGKSIAGPNEFPILNSGNKEQIGNNLSDNINIYSLKQPYQTVPSNFIHHTYETLNKPTIYQSLLQSATDTDRSRPYKNLHSQSARNSSLPRRLRKSKTPTPRTSKNLRSRPRSAQDHMIAGSEFDEIANYQNIEKIGHIHYHKVENFPIDMNTCNTFDATALEGSEMNSVLKSGSDQDDDEGIGEGDISTGSKSGERNTTSSSGASSGGSRSPDDEDDSARQMVHCVKSNVNHVKNANRRFLATLPSPSQGPPPRHLLPTKLKPSPAFKMHPLPLLHEPPTHHHHAFGKLGHPNMQLSNSQVVNSNSIEDDNSKQYLDHQLNVNKAQTLRIQGRIKKALENFDYLT